MHRLYSPLALQIPGLPKRKQRDKSRNGSKMSKRRKGKNQTGGRRRPKMVATANDVAPVAFDVHDAPHTIPGFVGPKQNQYPSLPHAGPPPIEVVQGEEENARVAKLLSTGKYKKKLCPSNRR